MKTIRYLHVVLLFVTVILLVIFSRCDEETIQPPPPLPPEPDTTTHEVVWTEFVVPRTGGMLQDVWAFSPDFAIAVGKVVEPYEPNTPLPNAYVWDGVTWTPQALPIQWSSGDTTTIDWKKSAWDVSGIWGFRRDNIWYCKNIGDSYAHMTIIEKDTMIKTESFARMGLSGFGRIWALDTNEIYFAGDFGGIVKYDGKDFTWMQINPPIDAHFIDIWGFTSDNIYTTAYNDAENLAYLYKYNGYHWEQIWNQSDPSLSDSVFFGAPTAIWSTVNDDSIWIAGLWLGRMKKDGTGKVHAMKYLEPYGLTRIRGTGSNNVFFIGNDGAILHYNGISIHEYPDFRGRGYTFLGLSISGDDIFIVGYKYWGGTYAAIIHGKMLR